MTTKKVINRYTIQYKSFVVEVQENNVGETQCVGYLNNEPHFGTFSSSTGRNALEKMKDKIDAHEGNYKYIPKI